MIACIRERNEDGVQRKKGDGLFQTIGDGAEAVMTFLEGEGEDEDHASDAFAGYA
jgi:hypothetical protein